MEKYQVAVNDFKNEKLLWHKWLEIAFVLEGTGVIFIDSQSYDIEEKDIFVVNSYQIHSVKMADEGKLFSLLINPEFVHNLLPEAEHYKFECKSFLPSVNDRKPYDEMRKQLAEVVYTLTKSEERFAETHTYMKISTLIECLIYNFGIQISNDQKSSDRFVDLIQYLNEYYDEDITLSKLAQREYMSQSYFSRLFQKEVGIKFTEFLSNIRITNSLAYLRNEKMTVTDIAYQVGFKNVNSFIDAFKKRYGVTPAKYRKQIPEKKVESQKRNLREMEDYSALFESLLTYVTVPDEKKLDVMEGSNLSSINIDVNLNTVRSKRKTPDSWKTLFNVGYAKDILYADIQKQIKRIQKEIGFKWIRFHGLLDDEMFVYSEKKDGTPYYCFQYIDQILDFILETGLKPVIEFGYMPELLAESVEYRLFQKRSVISLPSSIKKWKALIKAIMDHLAERYGIDEMKTWIFVPFYFLGFYKLLGKEKEVGFFRVYEETSRLIREFNPDFQQMGIYGQVNDLTLLEEFLRFAKENSCFPDIVGAYCYHLVEEEEDIGLNLKLIKHDDVFNIAVSGKESYLNFYGKEIIALLKRYGVGDRKMFLAIWSNNIWQRDLCNDTCYKSAFVFKDILENIENYQAFGYWGLSDLMEEMIPAKDVFHGGLGMFTISGIPKSAYWALWLLRYMGNYIIRQEDGLFITESENEVQIFLYNYCHYDNLYRYRHAAKLSRVNRYNVFLQKGAQDFHITIKGLDKGNYVISRYAVGKEKGNAYDQWVKIGAPPVPNRFEVQMLSGSSYPQFRSWEEQCDTEYTLNEKLSIHEIVVYIIKKEK